MTIKVVSFGKAKESYLKDTVKEYLSRLKHYLKIEYMELDDTSRAQEVFLSQVSPGDNIILLDEKGREYSSLEFAAFLQKKFNSATGNLTFIIGGAYGFEKGTRERGNDMLALSKMTFPHQMVRVIFLEQLYRAMTILRNEKYHH